VLARGRGRYAACDPIGAMRVISILLWALFGWPVSLWHSAAARRRLRAHRDKLGLTVERVA
jgi:hypothetical protein